MARVSKYESMIGSVVSMSFAEVKVTGYRNPQVTSKSGRTYRKYEVEIDNVLWVSTTSFKNQSFSKRYFKALKEQPVSELKQDILSIRRSKSLDELKKEYRRLSKKYHPDMGGSDKDFQEIKKEYDKCKIMLEAMVETFSEFGYEFEPVSEPVNEPVEPVKYELMPVSYLWFKLETEFNSELEKDIYELEHIDDIKQVKAKWRELSKKYHPDLGGNSKDFNAIHNAYKEHKKDLELIEKIMAEFSSEFGNDEDFEELVDLAKKASKAKARQY